MSHSLCFLLFKRKHPAKTGLICTRAPLLLHFMLVYFMNYLPLCSTNVSHSLLNCQYVTVKHTYAVDRLAHHLLQGESVEKAAVTVIFSALVRQSKQTRHAQIPLS